MPEKDKEDKSIDSQEFMTRVAASNGGQFCDSTSGTAGVVTGDFCWLVVITDTVLTSITSNFAGTSLLVGATLPAGTLIPGRTQSFQITSGILAAVNR